MGPFALSSPSALTLNLIRALFTKKKKKLPKSDRGGSKRILAFDLHHEKCVECLLQCKCLLGIICVISNMNLCYLLFLAINAMYFLKANALLYILFPAEIFH